MKKRCYSNIYLAFYKLHVYRWSGKRLHPISMYLFGQKQTELTFTVYMSHQIVCKSDLWNETRTSFIFSIIFYLKFKFSHNYNIYFFFCVCFVWYFVLPSAFSIYPYRNYIHFTIVFLYFVLLLLELLGFKTSLFWLFVLLYIIVPFIITYTIHISSIEYSWIYIYIYFWVQW